MQLTFDSLRSNRQHRHHRVATGAKLVPVVVEVPDEADRQADRQSN